MTLSKVRKSADCQYDIALELKIAVKSVSAKIFKSMVATDRACCNVHRRRVVVILCRAIEVYYYHYKAFDLFC